MKTIADTYQKAKGHNIYKAGDRIKIKRESGVFFFLRHVMNGAIEWIDVRHETNQHMRSFRPEQIKGRAK